MVFIDEGPKQGTDIRIVRLCPNSNKVIDAADCWQCIFMTTLGCRLLK